MPETVKVLSVRQPFADLILAGVKWCECRTWRTRHTGTLYIHASKWDGPREQTPGDGLTGAIIGRVKLVEIVDLEAVDPDDYDEQDRIIVPIAEKHGLPTAPENLEFVGGPLAWILAEPELIEPIPATGKLNVWNIELP